VKAYQNKQTPVSVQRSASVLMQQVLERVPRSGPVLNKFGLIAANPGGGFVSADNSPVPSRSVHPELPVGQIWMTSAIGAT